MLGVVQDLDLYAKVLAESVDQGGDRAIAAAGDGKGGPAHREIGAEANSIGRGRSLVAGQPRPGHGRQVFGRKCVPHFFGADLGAAAFGDDLDAAAELDLEPARQVHAVLVLHDVRHATLAGLAVDPDHGLVAPADVLGVDRQVGHLPGRVIRRQALHAFLDRVLVRAREGRVYEVTHVWVARFHGQAVAVLGDTAQGVDIADVKLRVHALAEQVAGEVDDVHIAGPLAVTEKRSLYAIRTGHQAELRRSHGRAAVVVRV